MDRKKKNEQDGDIESSSDYWSGKKASFFFLIAESVSACEKNKGLESSDSKTEWVEVPLQKC